MSDVTRRMAKSPPMSEAQVKATPRPWRVYDRGVGFEVVADENDNPVNGGFRECFTKADAELIVRAVNSHDKLLGALKAYDKAVTALTDQQLIDNQPLMSAVLNGRAAIQSAEQSPK